MNSRLLSNNTGIKVISWITYFFVLIENITDRYAAKRKALYYPVDPFLSSDPDFVQ